ncbi:DUF563 domain-containing protein [Rhodoblastus sp.]|uniref:glycosyltransferase family 61 protein n=1 Tax=Rhodoblastus sp. TaxID=1962975 RepID=UPI0035AF91C7
MTGAEAGVFRLNFFDLGETRLALNAPFWRGVSVRPAAECARALQPLPSGGGLALFEDACSLAPGVLMTAESVVIAESLIHSEQTARFGSFRRHGGGLKARLWPLTPMRRFKGDFIVLRMAGDGDYARWLIELLPRVAIAAQFCDLSQFQIAVSRGSEKMRAVVRDSLGLFGVAPDRIVALGAAPVFLQRSVCPFADAAPSPDALEVLESFPLRLPASADAPKRIFVASDLPDALRDLGFSALDPAAMPFAQRVQAFAQAEIVVGPAGAHLANVVFAPRGVRVLALTGAGDDLSLLRAVTALKQGPLKTLDPDQSARLPAALDEWIA